MIINKSQRLTFTFSNSGVLQTYTRDPELIAKLGFNRDCNTLAYHSSKIVHTLEAGYELNIDTPSEPPEWVNNLKIELGMPSDARLRHLTTQGTIFGLRWQKYYLRFLGIVVDSVEQAEVSWPFWRISNSDGQDVEVVQVWYQRVAYMESPVYCDAKWRPGREKSVTFPNLENARKARDITAAWRGGILLEKINPLGRPENSETLTRSQFMERAPLACAKLFSTFGETPTDLQIAEELRISRATLYRYMDRDGLTLNEIRDKAVSLIIEPSDSPF